MAQLKTTALNLESMQTLGDGELGILFRNQLMRISRDCVDRPHDSTKRLVTLQVATTPVCSPKGEFMHCNVEIECKAKVPVYRTAPYQMQADANGFRFNQDFPGEIDQMALPLDEDE